MKTTHCSLTQYSKKAILLACHHLPCIYLLIIAVSKRCHLYTLFKCRLLNLPIPYVIGSLECSEEDIYTIIGYEFDWKCVGRRLVGDQKVRDIDHEGHNEAERKDNMLLEWKRAKSGDATY